MEICEFIILFIENLKTVLNQPYALRFDISLSTLITLYFTILTGLLGIAFTAISIKSSKNLTIALFFRYGLPKIYIITIPLFTVICTIITFAFFLIKIDDLLLKHILFFILSFIILFSFFAIFIYYLFTADSKKRGLKLLKKYLLKSKENYPELENLYKTYIKKLFEDERYNLLEEFSSKVMQDDNFPLDIIYRENIVKLFATDFISDEKNLSEPEYKKGFELFRTKMIQSLKNIKNDEELREFRLCVNIFLKLHTQYIFNDNMKHWPYLLCLRDPLYFNILNPPSNLEQGEQLKKSYIMILTSSTNLLIYSLRNNTLHEFNLLLEDYISFGQFMTDDLIRYHYSNQLILIITWILHFNVHSMIESDALRFIPGIVKDVYELPVNDIDDVFYTPEVNYIHVEKVKETKNYYIALMLLYIIDDDTSFNDAFSKLKYHSLHGNEDKWTGYRILSDELEKIDFKLYSDLYPKTQQPNQEDFSRKKINLKNKLDNEIQESQKYEIAELRAKVTNTMIEEYIHKQIESIKNNFIKYFSIETEKHKSHYKIKSNIILSYKQILHDPSIHVVETDFFEVLNQNFLINFFMQYATPKYISSFSELSNFIKADASLLVTTGFQDDIFRSQEIAMGTNTLRIDTHSFNYRWVHSSDCGIIEEEIYKKSICLCDLSVDDSQERTEQETATFPDITLSIPVIFDFGIDTSLAKYYSIPK